jgi:hypothetical protein
VGRFLCLFEIFVTHIHNPIFILTANTVFIIILTSLTFLEHTPTSALRTAVEIGHYITADLRALTEKIKYKSEKIT